MCKKFQKSNLKYKFQLDYILLCTVIVLAFIGMLFIYSASNYVAKRNYNNAFYYVIKQFYGFIAGLILMFYLYCIKIEKLQKIAIPLIIGSMLLLLLVFIPGIGIENYGAKRWIGIGGFSFQPSEIAKFSFIIFSSWYLSRKQFYGKNILSYLPVALTGGILCLEIILEPNMSVTICMGLLVLVMLYIGGMSKKAFLLIICIALFIVPILIIIEPYRLERIKAFLDPFASPKDEGYQLIQSLYALGSGNWFGVGLFNSRQKYMFLPFAESDFIFSIIGEELGFFGAILVISLFILILYRGINISINAKTKYECLLGGGITSIIAIQTLINIAVVSGSIPPTGIPLPFISLGGTSLMVFMGAIGILLNISNNNKNNLLINKN